MGFIMIATTLTILSKFLVFMGKLMTAMIESWRQTFVATKLAWQQIANDLLQLIHYGIGNMIASVA